MLLRWFYERAQNQGGDRAVTDDRGSVTFGELAVMAVGLAKLIGSMTQQARVGCVLPSSSAFTASFYGALMAGRTLVPINFLLSPEQIGHIIRDSGIDLILSVSPLIERMGEMPGVRVVDLMQLPRPSGPVPLPIERKLAPDSTAALLYTSATTGMPKGVPLTQSNLDSCAEACVEHVFRGGNHSFLGLVPTFHSLGLLATVVAPMRLGAPVTFAARFSPVGVFETLRKQRPSIVIAIPSMFRAMLMAKAANGSDFSSVFAAICGGEALPATTREMFSERFGVRLMEGYGLTETCGPVSVNTPERYRAGSVGSMIPGAEVRVVDECGMDVKAGSTGEILLRGPMVMDGYFNLPEVSRSVFSDGWFRTGDIGHVDVEGYLFITGRAKDIIIVGGEKLYPREIEEMLLSHAAVAEAAVIGRPDESRGEAVVAFVSAREGMSIDVMGLRVHLREMGLPGWKMPRDVHVVQQLPRSPTGKVLKRELAQMS
jgi:long-chain acyl-CoA synthetase